MKRHIIITLAALAALTSCVTVTRVAQDTPSSRYQDGIYYALSTSNPVTAEVSDSETQTLINKTRGSQIFLKNDQKVDTLFIPQNMSATLQFNDNNSLSSITLNERPYWNTFYPYNSVWYNPYSLRSRIYYRDMVWTFGWDPFYYRWYDPFYWDIYYSPYYYSSWYYSPFYYDYWYSPFYYGYYPHYYYDPFYYGHHHYYSYYSYGGYHGHGYHGIPAHHYDNPNRTYIGRAPRAAVSSDGGVRREGTVSTKSAPANSGSTVRRLPAGSSATTRVAGTSSRPAGTSASSNVQTRSSSSASSASAASRSTTSNRATNGSAANTTYRRAVPSSSRSTGSSSSGSVSRSSGSAPRSSGSVSRSSGSVSRSSGSVSRSSGGYSGGGRSSGGGGGYSGGGSSGGGGGHSSGGSSGGGGGRGR